MPTKTKPRTSHQSEVHRSLSLVSPLMQGPDVRALQQQLNHQNDHYGFTWHHIREDGDYGRRTYREAKFVAWLIGLADDTVKHPGHLNEKVQQVLRDPGKRTDADRKRESDRKDKRHKLKQKHDTGVKAGTAFLKKYVGVNEDPPESNHGPFPINECQQFFGLSGVPWCGCLVGYVIKKICGIASNTWWPYAGSVRVDAQAGNNGLHDINPADATEGCVCTFFNGGDDHVTWVVSSDAGRGILHTLEGNTSSATRSSDGGIIEAKERSFSEVSCCLRVEAFG